MMGFNNIIGHEEVIRHLKNAIETGKVSHSYIFTGEPGSGKKLLAGTFAATLQCEEQGTEPCQKCDSCKKAMGKNHPDIIIRPYYSPYKIYIVADADLMTPQAQNALLKTIEEPPKYAVIILLTSNIGGLLPTIQSRCVRLDLKVVNDGLVKKYLMEHRKAAYTAMLLKGTLWAHLTEIDQAANQQIESMMAELAMSEGVTEELKAANQMEWVQRMNNIRQRAEEIVMADLIYS